MWPHQSLNVFESSVNVNSFSCDCESPVVSVTTGLSVWASKWEKNGLWGEGDKLNLSASPSPVTPVSFCYFQWGWTWNKAIQTCKNFSAKSHHSPWKGMNISHKISRTSSAATKSINPSARFKVALVNAVGHWEFSSGVQGSDKYGEAVWIRPLCSNCCKEKHGWGRSTKSTELISDPVCWHKLQPRPWISGGWWDETRLACTVPWWVTCREGEQV